MTTLDRMEESSTSKRTFSKQEEGRPGGLFAYKRRTGSEMHFGKKEGQLFRHRSCVTSCRPEVNWGLTREEEADQFYRRSVEFLESAELQMSKRFYALSIFGLEQSLQLLLKSKLLGKGAEFPRTHSVKKLMKLLSELSAGECAEVLEIMLKTYTLELGILEDACITSRYGIRDFEKEEAEKILSAAKVIIDGIRKDC